MGPTRRLVAGAAPLLILGCRGPAGAATGKDKDTGMGHVVLLGDSIFDNEAYVGAGPDVIAQVRSELGTGWRATLLAVDGAVTEDVRTPQLEGAPSDATHLVISAGGNDALGSSSILSAPARSVSDALSRLADAQDRFRRSYLQMVEAVLARRLPTALCTIYDANHPEPEHRLVVAALALFNDVITRAAFANRLDLIDLRLIFAGPADYANPIEPSSRGGEKIARAISAFARSQSAAPPRSQVWT
jgi:hypothetical protein